MIKVNDHSINSQWRAHRDNEGARNNVYCGEEKREEQIISERWDRLALRHECRDDGLHKEEAEQHGDREVHLFKRKRWQEWGEHSDQRHHEHRNQYVVYVEPGIAPEPQLYHESSRKEVIHFMNV